MSFEDVRMHIGPLSRLDDDISALTAQLTEIGLYDARSKAKYKADEIPDVDLAFRSFQAEISAHITFLSDLKLSHSIAHAIDVDGEAISEIIRDDSQLRQDRNLALQITRGNPELEALTPPPSYEQANFSVFQEEIKDPSSWIWDTSESVDDDDKSLEEEAGPSTAYEKRQKVALETLTARIHECCVCTERFTSSGIIRLQCSDLYCTVCLKELFMRATKDESLFPPRCCREPVSLEVVKANMFERELEVFEEASLEFSTTDRTYCSNKDCGKFLPPSQVTASRAQCPTCGATTCTMCKNTFHEDDCPADPLLRATLELAMNEGWRRCARCRAMVELKGGCFHMTCKCSFEFCYLCGLKWKTCICDAWNERNLVNRAGEVVDREADRPLHRPERERRIEQMREELRENHECEHSRRFQRIFGGRRTRFECEECGARHRKFILQCRRCHIEVCEDCRRNRFR